MDEHLQTVAQVKNTLIDLAIRFGPKVLVALIILAAGFFVGRWVGRMIEQMLEKIISRSRSASCLGASYAF